MASIHSSTRRHTGGGDNGNDNDNDGPSAITPAMSLFEKFSMLDRGIDETREETKKTRLKIDEVNQSISRTRQERDAMKRDIVSAQSEAKEYNNSIDYSSETLFEMEGERGRVMMEKQQAQRELDQVKAFVDEQRRQFFDQSKAFRASCKRARLQSASLGLQYAPLKAYATVMVEEAEEMVMFNKKIRRRSVHVVAPSDFSEANHSSIFAPATADGEEADLTCDPISWIPASGDGEMINSLQAYKKEWECHQKVKQSLEELKSKGKTASDEAKKRSERKQRQMAQLNSLKKDCEGTEREIAELQVKTIDKKEEARAYEKGQ